jgi:DNA replication licensing factor MCM7
MVHLRGGLTRSLKAGDSVTLSGIFLPEPYTGQRAMLRATLLTATYMEVMHVRQNKQSYQEMVLSDAQRAEIEAMTEEGDIYTRLATSIAPGGCACVVLALACAVVPAGVAVEAEG